MESMNTKTLTKPPILFLLGFALSTSLAAAADRPSIEATVAAGPSRIDVRCDARSSVCENDSIAKRLGVAVVWGDRWGAELAWEKSDDYGGSQRAATIFTGRVDL